MSHLLKFAGLVIAFQVGMISSAILSTPFSDLPLEATFSFYLPAIVLVQSTGNFVGCANMIAPVMYGVPLGIFGYALVGGYCFRFIKFVLSRAS